MTRLYEGAAALRESAATALILVRGDEGAASASPPIPPPRAPMAPPNSPLPVVSSSSSSSASSSGATGLVELSGTRTFGGGLGPRLPCLVPRAALPSAIPPAVAAAERNETRQPAAPVGRRSSTLRHRGRRQPAAPSSRVRRRRAGRQGNVPPPPPVPRPARRPARRRRSHRATTNAAAPHRAAAAATAAVGAASPCDDIGGALVISDRLLITNGLVVSHRAAAAAAAAAVANASAPPSPSSTTCRSPRLPRGTRRRRRISMRPLPTNGRASSPRRCHPNRPSATTHWPRTSFRRGAGRCCSPAPRPRGGGRRRWRRWKSSGWSSCALRWVIRACITPSDRRPRRQWRRPRLSRPRRLTMARVTPSSPLMARTTRPTARCAAGIGACRRRGVAVCGCCRRARKSPASSRGVAPRPSVRSSRGTTAPRSSQQAAPRRCTR